MIHLRRILFAAFLLLACSTAIAQQAREFGYLPSLDELLKRNPEYDGEVFDVATGPMGVNWGGSRRIRWKKASVEVPNNANSWATKTGVGVWKADDSNSNPQDPRWWGAYPDDGADDTAAFQKMADAGIGGISVPIGRFDISGDGVTWSNPVAIEGWLRSRSAFFYGGNKDCFSFVNAPGSPQNIGTLLRELTFLCRSDIGTPRSMLRVQGPTRATFERLSITSDRELGYPPLTSGILLNEQAWIIDISRCQIGYLEVGINMQCTNIVNSIVSAIDIDRGEIFGNRYGILIGSTNQPSIDPKLKVNIWMTRTTIEANGAYGLWANGAEATIVGPWYTEANGHLYKLDGSKYFTNELRSADIVLGNDFDTSTNYSCGVTSISGIRFADSTNGIIVKSAKGVDIANNIWVGARGPDNIIVSTNAKNVTVWENNSSSSQSSGFPTIIDPGNVVATRRASVDLGTGLPVVSQSAIQRFGDFDLSDVYWSADREFYMRPHVAVQTISSNSPVGVVLRNWGRAGFPGAGWRMDGSNVTFYSKTESGTPMPFSMDINGTEQFRLETLTARFRGNLTVHTTSNVDNLTVDGSIAAGSPPEYSGGVSGSPTYRVSLTSTNSANTLGTIFYSHDGTYNAVARMTLDPTPGAREFVIGMSYSSGGNIPVRIKSPVKGILAEFWDPSTNWTALRLHLNGSLQEVRWDPISKTLYAGSTVPPVSTNGHTHAGSDITSGTINVARLGSGSGSTNTFLNGQGAFTTPPAPGTSTNGVAEAPLDGWGYLRLGGAWAIPAITNVTGLQTALDDRQTYDSMSADGVVAGGLTSTAGLTVYDVPEMSPDVDLKPMVFNEDGFVVSKMNTNDFLIQIGAMPWISTDLLAMTARTNYFSEMNRFYGGLEAQGVGFHSTRVGTGFPDSAGDYSTVVGDAGQALSTGGTAIGGATYSRGVGATALGNGSTVDGDYGISIHGYAAGASTIAIGPGTSAAYPYSGAIGVDAEASAAYEIAIGGPLQSVAIRAPLTVTEGVSLQEASTNKLESSSSGFDFTTPRVRINGSNVVTEAPIDGLTYSRKDGAWVTNSATTYSSPIILASGAPVTITLTNETSLISLRSGESKTLSAGSLATGTVLKLEAEGDMTSGGGGANWANGVYRWKVGGLTISFTVAEPLSEDADHNTWSLRAFLVIQTAGSNATVKASGYVDYEYTTIVNPTRSTIRIRPTVEGILNTTGSNTTDLTFENAGNVLTEFVGSAVVLWKL